MAKRADPLTEYNRKRDFKKTAEPAGKVAPGEGHRFIVQKHDATRLHYDLRLEKDGVLKSWAVTRGPSLDPEDKRLAVRTEDHPMSYAEFEGTIPKGEYGGGTVMLWDRGTWAPIEGKSADDLEKGHLHFLLDGERMKGEWLLVRMKRRPREKTENWLLRKVNDAEAGGSDELTGRYLTSITTSRTMLEIAAGKPAREDSTSSSPQGSIASEGAVPETARMDSRLRGNHGQKQKRRTATTKLPAFRKLQFATLVDTVPSGNAWLHEVKYDGYRALLATAGGKARVYTRTGLDWSDKFAEIVRAAEAADLDTALIDGEIVALDANGRPNFSQLQASLSGSGKGLKFFAFDLLLEGDEDLTGLPNIARKARLRALLPQEGDPLLYADHVVGQGEKLLEAMCAEGYEGIISKKADAPYAGRRTTAWLKIKCIRRQEFVIVGFTKSDAKGRPFRSLLLAQNDEDSLRYAGKVGTGFNRDTLDELAGKFAGLERKTAPVKVPREAARGAKWLKPELVAEIAFAEFTADDVVRHASFIGLREDKPASEVRPERPAPLPAADDQAAKIKISNPDRVIFPEAGVTKGELADYYRAVAPVMLAWAAGRPVSLVRCPQGRAKQCFFQKHDAGSFGEHVLAVPIKEKDGKTEDYIYVEAAAGLVACVQMGTIEFHGWGSTVAHVEKPDRMIFDLDPDVGLDFDDVKRSAIDIRRQLSDIGLVSFPMLSGGKGVHVVVPLTPEAEWPEVKDFARRFSTALAQAEPERYTATMSKAKRKGRIFIDWLRNQRGATAILPYSARSRAGAPVAAPISWEELRDVETAAKFTVKDAEMLLRRAGSAALDGWGIAGQKLPDL